MNELPEDGLKFLPEMSRFTENKWISRKNQNNTSYTLLIFQMIYYWLLTVTSICEWSIKLKIKRSVCAHYKIFQR